MARISGFHPEEGGSKPLGATTINIYMIKVWSNNIPFSPMLWNRKLSVIIDWDREHDDIAYVNNIDNADVVFLHLVDAAGTAEQISYLTKMGYRDQRIIVLHLLQTDETLGNMYTGERMCVEMWRAFAPGKVLFLDPNACVKNLPFSDTMYYDLVFERHKVYHTEYEQYDLKDRIFTGIASQKMYELSPIIKNKTAKHFLAPMRTYENLYDAAPRMVLRNKLRQLLDSSKGYTSDLASGQIIMPQESTAEIMKIFTDDKHSYGGGTWMPAHNDYYNDSIVSVYVETITYGSDYRSVTEKTMDPLIKGNFILPFGYRGLIKDIREYGFRLPDWIDYSYDDLNDVLRWEAYTDVVKQILSMDQQALYNRCINDMDILQHNRNIFYTAPRADLVSKIRNWIDKG